MPKVRTESEDFTLSTATTRHSGQLELHFHRSPQQLRYAPAGRRTEYSRLRTLILRPPPYLRVCDRARSIINRLRRAIARVSEEECAIVRSDRIGRLCPYESPSFSYPRVPKRRGIWQSRRSTAPLTVSPGPPHYTLLWIHPCRPQQTQRSMRFCRSLRLRRSSRSRSNSPSQSPA